jgi:hypothetical protein
VITIREAKELIRVIEFCGGIPMVFLSINHPYIYQGCHGLFVEYGVILAVVNLAVGGLKRRQPQSPGYG